MLVRGYRGTWPLASPPAMRRCDKLCMAVGFGLLLAAYLLLERGSQ
jgi:hypothetical protein